MSIYAVSYTYSDDVATRDEVRPSHRDFLRGLNAEGVVRASGPVDGGIGALVVLEAESAEDALRILDADPFQVRGVIAERGVRQWDVVIGGLAE
ncbi:YciI family protein [Promicromonospora sp. NPDC050249]|uniref:YciI family protein n=1 Tax=Promicromonospora sp. NPDC050249 TaxID=3154743 RepID=UPI000D5E97E2